jgi:hypothetical protein
MLFTFSIGQQLIDFEPGFFRDGFSIPAPQVCHSLGAERSSPYNLLSFDFGGFVQTVPVLVKRILKVSEKSESTKVELRFLNRREFFTIDPPPENGRELGAIRNIIQQPHNLTRHFIAYLRTHHVTILIKLYEQEKYADQNAQICAQSEPTIQPIRIHSALR